MIITREEIKTALNHEGLADIRGVIYGNSHDVASVILKLIQKSTRRPAPKAKFATLRARGFLRHLATVPGMTIERAGTLLNRYAARYSTRTKVRMSRRQRLIQNKDFRRIVVEVLSKPRPRK